MTHGNIKKRLAYHVVVIALLLGFNTPASAAVVFAYAVLNEAPNSPHLVFFKTVSSGSSYQSALRHVHNYQDHTEGSRGYRTVVRGGELAACHRNGATGWWATVGSFGGAGGGEGMACGGSHRGETIRRALQRCRERSSADARNCIYIDAGCDDGVDRSPPPGSTNAQPDPLRFTSAHRYQCDDGERCNLTDPGPACSAGTAGQAQSAPGRPGTGNAQPLSQAEITKLLDAVGESNMIVIGPADAKRTLTVFTDVDCPFCARLHQDVPELNRQGIKVRYLLFPSSGIGSPAYKKSVAVWCADHRIKAIGITMTGGRVNMRTCPNPVEQHYRLGKRLGVRSTPTVYLDDGQRIGGYSPVSHLLPKIGLAPPTARKVTPIHGPKGQSEVAPISRTRGEGTTRMK